MQALQEILRERSVSLNSLPADIRAAVAAGTISPAMFVRYLEVNKRPVTGFFVRLGSGFRSRILADPKFLFKIAVEEAIGVTGKISAELNKRKEKFWKEFDFVLANIIMAIIADFALVWVPAPVAQFAASNPAVASVKRSALQTFVRSLPSSCLQKPVLGKTYSLQQRTAAYFLKAFQLFGVGFVSSATGTGITTSLLAGRKLLDPTFEPENAPPPIVKTSLLYGTFMSASSNTRYQMLNGLEQWIVDPVLHNAPMASKVATFVLRFGNTFWGSSQWVDFTRLMGVAKSKDAPAEDASKLAARAK